MKATRLIGLIVILVASIAVAAPPKPAESKYLRTLGGMFLFGVGEIRYAMTYEIKDEMPENFVVRVSFENPKKGEFSLPPGGMEQFAIEAC